MPLRCCNSNKFCYRPNVANAGAYPHTIPQSHIIVQIIVILESRISENSKNYSCRLFIYYLHFHKSRISPALAQ